MKWTQDPLFVCAVFSFVLLYLANSFICGYYHNSEKSHLMFLRKWGYIIDPDLFFGTLDARLVLAADILGAWVCFGAIVAILINGTICHFAKDFINLTGIFWITGLAGSWLTRAIFILIYKKQTREAAPLLWPYKRWL